MIGAALLTICNNQNAEHDLFRLYVDLMLFNFQIVVFVLLADTKYMCISEQFIYACLY